MKQTKIFIQLLALILLLSSCKKGEDDPFFSFKTRTSRLSGDWIIKNLDYTLDEKQDGITTRKTVYTYSGNTLTITEHYSDTSYSFSIIYTETFSIDKKGTYKKTAIVDSDTYNIEGNWMWLSKNKELELKNKEAIALTVTNDIDNNIIYTGKYNIPNNIYVLKELSDKKMVIDYKNEYSNETGYSGTETATITYEKK